MSKVTKNEKVSIVYKNDKITVTGPSIKAVLSISGDELSKMYWGNVGHGSVDVTIDIPDEKPKEAP